MQSHKAYIARIQSTRTVQRKTTTSTQNNCTKQSINRNQQSNHFRYSQSNGTTSGYQQPSASSSSSKQSGQPEMSSRLKALLLQEQNKSAKAQNGASELKKPQVKTNKKVICVEKLLTFLCVSICIY